MGFLNKAWDAAKSMIGVRTDYEDEQDMYDEADGADIDEPRFEQKPVTRRSKIIPIGTSNNSQESIGIIIINSFAETQTIARELKSRRPVIFSVDALDYNEARRVVDYVAGTIYGIDGDIKKVQGSIFIATPSHISIEAVSKSAEKMREVVGVDVAL